MSRNWKTKCTLTATRLYFEVWLKTSSTYSGGYCILALRSGIVDDEQVRDDLTCIRGALTLRVVRSTDEVVVVVLAHKEDIVYSRSWIQ